MKVYFYQRKTHRKRQRETVEFCPKEIEAVGPENISYIADSILSNRHADRKLHMKSRLSKLVPLNTHKINLGENPDVDYIYTWGCIPQNRKPYVLEMDNPYCICYYNLFWFYLLLPVWKRILRSKRLHSIVCISEACKKSIELEYGKKIAEKTHVVYPHMQNHLKDKSDHEGEIIEFLFVSTQFFLKGGRETVAAIRKVHEEGYNVHLTMISNLEEIGDMCKGLDFISCYQANIEKEKLHAEYFSKADVFILPSYQDSFGLVYLEALSFGLPIIATNMYAIPEMVVDGKNGYLADLPIKYFEDNGRLNQKYKKGNIVNEIKRATSYDKTIDQLASYIRCLCEVEKRKEMAKYSESLFLERYSSKVRDKAFADVFRT